MGIIELGINRIKKINQLSFTIWQHHKITNNNSHNSKTIDFNINHVSRQACYALNKHDENTIFTINKISVKPHFLTHFVPLVSFNTPWGVMKETSGMKWVNMKNSRSPRKVRNGKIMVRHTDVIHGGFVLMSIKH